MFDQPPLRVAYLVKMYPRFSETFIVNEILAHEAAGVEVQIVSLRAPVDGRYHEDHARVRAGVTYVPGVELKAAQLWQLFHATAARFPTAWRILSEEPALDIADMCQAMWLAPVLVDRGVDVVHAHFGSVATTVARLVHRLTGIPYLFTAHAKDIYHESVDAKELRAKLAAADAIVTVSDFNLDHLHMAFGRDAHRVVRIYNGLPLHRFPYTPPADRPRRIVAVGRLVEKKGFSVLVDACRILCERSEPFTCDIIGSGQEEAALRRQIDTAQLGDRVRLVGPRPQGEVIAAMQQAAAFVAPCIVGKDGNRDGLPTVLIEAMALGTPCVSTDVTGIPELVEDGVTGLLVGQNDAAALAGALQRLLDDAGLRARLAGAARARIERDFDVAQNGAQLRSLYAQIVRSRARAVPAPVRAQLAGEVA